MPGGSVVGRIDKIKLEYRGETEIVTCNSHIPTLDAIVAFANSREKTLILVLENGIEIMFSPEFWVSFGSNSKIKPFHITDATVFRMRDEAHYSRSNEATPETWSALRNSPDKATKALLDFALAPVRCKLILAGKGGPEIGIYPSFKPNILAHGEGLILAGPPTEVGPAWDLCVELWPMLEEWLGLEVGTKKA